nr:hypothetical protein [Holzapfeliella floricola]
MRYDDPEGDYGSKNAKDRLLKLS